MALVNDAKKEIHAKIVYYGPAKAGKTTNLEFIYNKLKPEYRGKFKYLNTPGGRMVFFDFMRPELAGIKDFSLHFHIYTVPGEVVDDAIWKNVLKGVDGIVFVADMDPARMLENRRSLEDLKSHLAVHSANLHDIPCIFQLNKKDLAEAMAPEDMKNLLEIGDVLSLPAAARSAEGVLPTLSEMVKMILQKLRDTPLGEEESLTVDEESSPTFTETAIEPEETRESTALYADLAETANLEAPVVEEEPLVLHEGLAEQDDVLAEEALPTVAPEETAGFEPSESILSELAFASEGDEPRVGAESLAEEQEPQEWATTPEPSAEAAETAVEESQPEIALDGTLESLGDGRYRLPLLVRYADKEKKACLTLTLGFE
ncbi:MAG: ADP-ribosylation factor-like protein [Geobacteraceae bacterium]